MAPEDIRALTSGAPGITHQPALRPLFPSTRGYKTGEHAHPQGPYALALTFLGMWRWWASGCSPGGQPSLCDLVPARLPSEVTVLAFSLSLGHCRRLQAHLWLLSPPSSLTCTPQWPWRGSCMDQAAERSRQPPSECHLKRGWSPMATLSGVTPLSFVTLNPSFQRTSVLARCGRC